MRWKRRKTIQFVRRKWLTTFCVDVPLHHNMHACFFYSIKQENNTDLENSFNFIIIIIVKKIKFVFKLKTSNFILS